MPISPSLIFEFVVKLVDSLSTERNLSIWTNTAKLLEVGDKSAKLYKAWGGLLQFTLIVFVTN